MVLQGSYQMLGQFICRTHGFTLRDGERVPTSRVLFAAMPETSDETAAVCKTVEVLRRQGHNLSLRRVVEEVIFQPEVEY